jgi:hypothetical protein
MRTLSIHDDKITERVCIFPAKFILLLKIEFSTGNDLLRNYTQVFFLDEFAFDRISGFCYFTQRAAKLLRILHNGETRLRKTIETWQDKKSKNVNNRNI